MDTRTQTGADDGQRVFLYNLIGRPVGKDVRHVLTFDWQRDSQLDGHIHQHSHNRKNVMLIASNFIHYLHVFTRNGTEKILLFILKPLLILLGVRLVANRCQTFGLGVVVVEAHVQLLVKFIDEVLHGLEAHHLREVLQLWELFAAERRQRNGFCEAGRQAARSRAPPSWRAADPRILRPGTPEGPPYWCPLDHTLTWRLWLQQSLIKNMIIVNLLFNISNLRLKHKM